MRELKFRMPIIVKNKFSEWFYWGFIDGDFITPHSNYRINESYQFTGLKDKNGKDVFEGDIVTWKHLDKELYEVYYNTEECHYFAKHLHSKEETESYLDSKKMEVIGNRFENPELL